MNQNMHARVNLEEIVPLIMEALPDWSFVSKPIPFTWSCHVYLRARLAKGNDTQDVVIRRSRCDKSHEIEIFLYRSVLPHLSVHTPKLLATFEQAVDGSKWMVLEDIGVATARSDCVEHRRAFLRALGCLHAQSMGFLGNPIFYSGVLKRFEGKSVLYGGKVIPFQKWRELLEKGLSFPLYQTEKWMLQFADAMLIQLGKQPATLLHGDAQFGNAILTDDGVGLIDFERAWIGPPSMDIGQVVEKMESLEELEDYNDGFFQTTKKRLCRKTIIDWAHLAEGYNCLYWMCYYVEEAMKNKHLGEERYKNRYDQLHERLRQLYEQRGDLFQITKSRFK